jgi:hypothetical protein
MAEQDYVDFWGKFHKKMESLNVDFKLYEFPSKSNSNFSAKVNDSSPGATGTPFIGVDLVNSKGFIRVNVYIPNDKDFYDSLFAEKNEIENVFGNKLQWKRDCGKASRILVEIPGLNFKYRDNYDILMVKLIEIIKKFIITFEKRIKNWI